jgi:hypothetical protein
MGALLTGIGGIGNAAGMALHTTTTPERGGGGRSATKKLAAVIRDGLPRLNQHALQIQACPQTRQPLVPKENGGEDDENDEATSAAAAASYGTQPLLSPRQLSAGRRLMDVVSDVLEQMHRNGNHNSSNRSSSPNGGGGGASLTIAGEPIVLLDAVVHADVRSAVIYWTLPYSLLESKSLSVDDKLELVEWFHHQMQTPFTPQHAALSRVARLAAARMRHFRVPRILWKPAGPETVLAMQQYCRDDDGDQDPKELEE